MVSVGKRLYEERIKKGLTLDEVAKATKIRSSFLSAIEKGEYSNLPSSAYIQGFVKNYAEFLGLPKKEFSALFRREFNEKEFLSVLPKGLATKNDIPLKRLRFGTTAVLVLLVFIMLSTYLLFQYRYSIINPPLEVYLPKENQVINQSVTINGKTDPNATVYINNDPVFLDSTGSFKKNIELFPGKRIIKIKSVNRFGKETVLDRHVDVKSTTE